MIQCSPSCWLKTSVESGAPGQPSQLGVVVTNGGFSDWSTQDFPSSIRTVSHGGGGGPDGNPWHAGIGSLVLRVGARASMGGPHCTCTVCALVSSSSSSASVHVSGSGTVLLGGPSDMHIRAVCCVKLSGPVLHDATLCCVAGRAACAA
jgi:hypothetical protein